MTKKERIIHLSAFFNVEDIAETVNSTANYVKKVLSEHKHSSEPIKPILTIENYMAAERCGIKSIMALAAYFRVSDKTNKRFRSKYKIKELRYRYRDLRNNNYGLEEVLQHLTSTYETLAICEPGSDIARKVSQAIELLQKCDKKDNRPKC